MNISPKEFKSKFISEDDILGADCDFIARIIHFTLNMFGTFLNETLVSNFFLIHKSIYIIKVLTLFKVWNFVVILVLNKIILNFLNSIDYLQNNKNI